MWNGTIIYMRKFKPHRLPNILKTRSSSVPKIKSKVSVSIVMLILLCQNGWSITSSRKVFAAKECISCATVFGKRHKKDNKMSFLPYKTRFSQKQYLQNVQKTKGKKNGQIDIISFVFSFLFLRCQCACYFLYFIGLDCYRAGTKLDKSECLKANGQENVLSQFERCTIACER